MTNSRYGRGLILAITTPKSLKVKDRMKVYKVFEKVALRAGFMTVQEYLADVLINRVIDDIEKYFLTNREREELYEKLGNLKR